MENFAYIDKNVYINIFMLILKKLKEYLLGVGIFKLFFCLFIILLSIIFAKRSKKKKKKINVYLQLNRNNTKNNELVINDDKTLYNDEEKTNNHNKEEKEIENEAYHITHSSHIFDLKVISTTELCNVCNDNIYAFIFNKKNIFECVICKNKCHIECAPNSNLMSCKNSVFFKNKHKFIKIKNTLWNGKCDICNQNFSYFLFSLYGIKYIYKCMWCNKYFHGKCINKKICKKIYKKINNNNNDTNTKNGDLICAYGNNQYILYPYEISVKENYLLYFLIQSYQKINKAQIKKDDILLSYNETQSENYTCEDELVIEKEIDKFSIQMFENDKNRELIYFNYLNNAKKYQSLINSQIIKNDNNNNNSPIIDKQNHTIHINTLLNFLPIHVPIYEINTTNKFLLIFVNVRSGGQTGKNLYRELLMHFNPLQIINIENESSVINTLNMYKEMLYQKKVIIFLCGGDGTISIFIDTLIKFFYNNTPFNIYEENENFPKKKIQKKKIFHITENSNKISNKAITFFNKYIMAASKVALKKSGNNTSKIMLNKERDETKSDFINNSSDTKKSISLLENDEIYSLIEDKHNMSNECDDKDDDNNVLLNNGTNIYSDLYKNYDDNSFINRGTKTEIDSNASLSNESISHMSPFPNSDSMCNSFRKNVNKKKYINLLENVNIYKDKKEKDDMYIDQTLNDSHINKSVVENCNNNDNGNNNYCGYISGYSNNFIDINKPWNNNQSYIYSCSLKHNKTDSNIIYHDYKENEIEYMPTETKLHNNNSSYYKENDIINSSIKYGNNSSDQVHSNYYRDDESSDTSESLYEEEKIQKKNNETKTKTKTKKWLRYISKESEKIHNKFIKKNINKIQERFNLNKSQPIESDNSLYKFHKNGKNKYKIINKKKHKQIDSINDNNSKTSNNKYTVKSYIENTPIGIMPLGTGNDLCISLGWGGSYINNISYILGGHNIWKDDNLQYCYYYTQSLENINNQRGISKSCLYKCCDKMKENIKHIDDENNTTDYSNIYKPHKLYLYKRKKNSQMYKKQQIDDKLIEVFGIKNIFHLVQVQLGLSGPVKLCQGHELFIKISKKFIQNNKMYFQYDGEPVFLKICKLHFTHKCQCLFLSPNSPIL